MNMGGLIVIFHVILLKSSLVYITESFQLIQGAVIILKIRQASFEKLNFQVESFEENCHVLV